MSCFGLQVENVDLGWSSSGEQHPSFHWRSEDVRADLIQEVAIAAVVESSAVVESFVGSGFVASAPVFGLPAAFSMPGFVVDFLAVAAPA